MNTNGHEWKKNKENKEKILTIKSNQNNININNNNNNNNNHNSNSNNNKLVFHPFSSFRLDYVRRSKLPNLGQILIYKGRLYEQHELGSR